MKSKHFSIIPAYLLILCSFLFVGVGGSHAITVLSESAPIPNRLGVVIDAGHGGVDGGATSCTGVLESSLNLDIALRLNDLMHLLGIKTTMIRTSDQSIHTEGNTIAAKKVSDLKERVRIINQDGHALLVSIHQNYFGDSRYSGPQVFYANTPHSKDFAIQMQTAFVKALSKGSNRKAKKADGVYLMKHINCTGILVECGFLSNPQEEALLRQEEYQKKLCSVIASNCSLYLHGEDSKSA